MDLLSVLMKKLMILKEVTKIEVSSLIINFKLKINLPVNNNNNNKICENKIYSVHHFDSAFINSVIF